ncbi:MAG TPA: hypothetical protein DD618_02105 [Acholeplasmatales bacterium]|nr:hypothetical protein [Acholeplasmatales bacterium]
MKKVLFLVMAIVSIIAISGFSQKVNAQNPSAYPLGYEIALEKLGQDKLFVEVMDGVNDEDRYVLFTGKEVGYLIYDTELEIYIEYSTEDESPFAHTSLPRSKVYAGPTYYLEKSEEKYFDVLNKREVSKFEIEEFSRYNENMSASVLARKESERIERFNEEALAETPEPSAPESDPVYELEQTSTLSVEHEIPYSFYYENLRYNMGVNVDGTCSFIAAGMVLSYYDSVYNDEIVSEELELPGTRRISDSNAAPTEPFDSWSSIVPEAFNQSPGVSNDFLLETIDYMNVGNSMNIGQTGTLISHYLDQAGVDYSKKEWNLWEGLFTSRDQWVRDGIDSGNPVYIHFTGTDPDLDDRYLNHAVVGYEYDDTGVFVNFGWRGEYTHTNINNYTLQNVLYFIIHDDESAIYNYEWTSTNGADGIMCIGGEVVCNHNVQVKPIDEIYHLTGCFFCGSENVYTEHSFVNGVCTVCNYSHVNHVLGTTWYGTPSSHYRKCTICNLNVYCSVPATVSSYNSTTHTLSCCNGYTQTASHTYNSYNDCTVCGYHTTHTHAYTYRYVAYSTTTHKAYCSCGSFVFRPHVGIPPIDPNDPTYCGLCGYQMDGGGIMIIMKKDEDLEKFLV